MITKDFEVSSTGISWLALLNSAGKGQPRRFGPSTRCGFAHLLDGRSCSLTDVDPQFYPHWRCTDSCYGGAQIKEGYSPNRIYDCGLLDGSSINRPTHAMVTHGGDSEGAGLWQISNIKYPPGKRDRTPSICWLLNNYRGYSSFPIYH